MSTIKVIVFIITVASIPIISMTFGDYLVDHQLIAFFVVIGTMLPAFLILGPSSSCHSSRKNRKRHVSNDDSSYDNIKNDINPSTGFTMLGAVDSGGYARGDSPSSFEDYSSLDNNMFDDWK